MVTQHTFVAISELPKKLFDFTSWEPCFESVHNNAYVTNSLDILNRFTLRPLTDGHNNYVIYADIVTLPNEKDFKVYLKINIYKKWPDEVIERI